MAEGTGESLNYQAIAEPEAAVPIAPARRSKWHGASLTLISLVVFLGAWEGVIRVARIPSYLVPPPSAVLVALQQNLSSLAYWQAIGATLSEVLLGFFLGSLLGIGLGVVLALSATMNRVIYPYVVALQTVPKVAIAPLMIVWFGFGLQSKVLIVALTATFPLLVNTIAGLRATDQDRLDLLTGLCASRAQTLRYVQFPNALPYVFAGLNTAIVLAVIGAIVGEFVGAKQGLGVQILQANFNLDLASVFSSLMVLGVIGVILNASMRAIERRVCFWSGRRRG
jgi:NitT/TauT family transport system permease protein